MIAYSFDEELSPILVLLVVGIGNTSETSYVKAFASTCVREGFQVAVLNHLGGLEHVALTGNRIYTYGLLCAVHSELCVLKLCAEQLHGPLVCMCTNFLFLFSSSELHGKSKIEKRKPVTLTQLASFYQLT